MSAWKKLTTIEELKMCFNTTVVEYDINELSKSEASRKIDQIISTKGKIIR